MTPVPRHKRMWTTSTRVTTWRNRYILLILNALFQLHFLNLALKSFYSYWITEIFSTLRSTNLASFWASQWTASFLWRTTVQKSIQMMPLMLTSCVHWNRWLSLEKTISATWMTETWENETFHLNIRLNIYSVAHFIPRLSVNFHSLPFCQLSFLASNRLKFINM